ncbi:hypothetical protein A8L33_15040 (plasmid) [Microbacterium aurantiacum]|uniref:RNA polymerase sigma-70 domain-containing protein n=1 Tax=Microbacterium aurantiacum TaxID=162393 RepID=A0A0N0RRI4_9MICO|nr:hypothetical protein A8L33_07950 [Microbacterium chocolatum]ANG86886.1 hypothetical protein A8L33_15040 [Microbacterium chocolatum]KOS11053.1 hypothetical protein XI38_07210 [Microbacterium chocolatum]
MPAMAEGRDADLLDEASRHVPLKERIRGVPDLEVLAQMPIGVRMRNVLAREGLETFGAIKGMSVNDLLALRGAGVGSVREMLVGLELERNQHPRGGAALSERPARWQTDLVADFETLARWQRILGTEDVSVLAVAEEVIEPAEVSAARARIIALSASALLPDVGAIGAAASAIEESLAGLGEREMAVLRERVMADDPVSLDELGLRFGVTRERIRQVESKLMGRLTGLAQQGDLHSLVTIASGTIGDLVRLRTLVQRHPTLGQTVPSIGQPVWRFLDRIDPAYEIKDGWCALGTVAGAVARTKRAFAEIGRDRGFVELAAVDDPDLELGLDWLEYCGLTVLRGCVLLGRAGMPDRAEVVLHAQQEPLSSEAILAELGVDRSVRSLRNQLSEDPRFARVDRDDWALASWGLTGYLGIRAMIGRSLSAAGGEMTVDALIDDLTSRFNVSPRSIVAYATAFPYITSKGIVRRRGRRDMRRPRRKGLAQTRGLYRHDDRVKLRILVNSEHLRGSGCTLPNAIGEEIDLSIAEAKTLRRTGADGTILVSWRGPQIILGSVRAEVEKLGLSAGDTAFFVFGSDGTFGVEPMDEFAGLQSQMLALTGGVSVDDDLWETLADRVDLAAGDRDAVLAALSARGDARIVELAGTHAADPAG